MADDAGALPALADRLLVVPPLCTDARAHHVADRIEDLAQIDAATTPRSCNRGHQRLHRRPLVRAAKVSKQPLRMIKRGPVHGSATSIEEEVSVASAA